MINIGYWDAPVYKQYKDLHVVATLVYVGKYVMGQGYRIAYKDAERTVPFTPAEFEEVCIKGALFETPLDGSMPEDGGKLSFLAAFNVAEDDTTTRYAYSFYRTELEGDLNCIKIAALGE